MTDTHAPAAEHEGVHLELSHGMSDKGYVKLAFVLAIITAVEVAWSYLPVWDDATGALKAFEIGGLLFMMGLKFFGIAAYFMHLRFDNRILTRIFYSGLFLAVIVYVIVLTTFEFWGA